MFVCVCGGGGGYVRREVAGHAAVGTEGMCRRGGGGFAAEMAQLTAGEADAIGQILGGVIPAALLLRPTDRLKYHCLVAPDRLLVEMVLFL